MDEGVLADTTFHATFVTGRQAIATEWVQGSAASLPKVGSLARVRHTKPFYPDRARAFQVKAYRCIECGLLDLVAR